MKFSRRWLSDFLSPSAELPDDPALAALLTGRGMEIESYVVYGSRGLIAAKVLSVHLQTGTHLRVCEVDVGAASPLQIVCGAPNVAAEQWVVVAPPGAIVGDTTIQIRDIGGIRSAGMICSAAEIGIDSESADGIMTLESGEVVAGQPLEDYLHLADTVFDAGITPNRGDCLSHLGIAREVAAATGMHLRTPEESHIAMTDDIFPATIEAPAACPYYGGIIIRGVNAARPSPWWLRAKLARCGLRSIGAAVDITNYVMLATGQPLHAFDLDKLEGGICVRMAQEGESLTLLDGQTVCCDTDTVLIADRHKAVAMGGVMGGLESAVSAVTENIFLEGAFFAPAAIRGKTARYGLVSEAAFRFERGVDSLLPPRVLSMAATLMVQICGGVAGVLCAAGCPPPPSLPIRVDGKSIRDLLGIADIDVAKAAALLNALEIKTETSAGDICAKPPSWRFDLEYPADLSEEIIRTWGYDKLPAIAPPGGINILSLPARPFSVSNTRRRLAALGFAEALTFAFVPPHWETKLASGRGVPVSLQNPINQDMSVMRTTLLGGLIDRVLFNLNRRQDSLRLFEIGRCFVAGTTDEEWQKTQPLYVAGIAVGGVLPSQWGVAGRDVDFFDMKGWLEDFLHGGLCPRFDTELPRPAFLHPRQSANIIADVGDGGAPLVLGAMGVLHPQTAADFGFRRPPLVFELCLELLGDIRRTPQAVAVSRFPPVWRDLSVVSEASAREVLACVRCAGGDADLFDLYESGNIGTGKKCYGIRLTMRGIDKNLTDDDIRRNLATVTEALIAAGMELRQ